MTVPIDIKVFSRHAQCDAQARSFGCLMHLPGILKPCLKLEWNKSEVLGIKIQNMTGMFILFWHWTFS